MRRAFGFPWRRLLSACALALVSAAAGAERLQVELATVSRGPLVEEIPLNGTVTALHRSPVSVSVPGLVLERRVDVGDRVAAGDLLLRLDDELATLELARAAAEVREAESRLAEALRLLEQARSVRGGMTIAETETRRRESEVGVARATLARYRAAEALHAARVRRHRVEAPIAGVVSARDVEAGQWVEPGDAVLTLVDTEDLLLDFRAPQEALDKLDERARLLVEAPGGNGPQATQIERWLPVTDERARTFLLRARPPAGLALVPGMAVSARLQLVLQREALSVSRDAVNRYPEGRTTVWVAQPGGEDGVFTVREQRIRISGTAGGRIFVAEGLDGSERVVSRGNEALRDGVEVTLPRRP